ncbi:basic proline-rich protein-like [Vombatus ursinus]|uniref:basic proline-rich protein-like n=1 Tax=Vombatus ursinus TaxID=29139 RepID=UPI000FFD6850|nr:basic proline-rich protein-like [Vombatus ursinus]XP_027732447.1 basic proline-rich protein-like [Vombatus ursinus]
MGYFLKLLPTAWHLEQKMNQLGSVHALEALSSAARASRELQLVPRPRERCSEARAGRATAAGTCSRSPKRPQGGGAESYGKPGSGKERRGGADRTRAGQSPCHRPERQGQESGRIPGPGKDRDPESAALAKEGRWGEDARGTGWSLPCEPGPPCGRDAALDPPTLRPSGAAWPGPDTAPAHLPWPPFRAPPAPAALAGSGAGVGGGVGEGEEESWAPVFSRLVPLTPKFTPTPRPLTLRSSPGRGRPQPGPLPPGYIRSRRGCPPPPPPPRPSPGGEAGAPPPPACGTAPALRGQRGRLLVRTWQGDSPSPPSSSRPVQPAAPAPATCLRYPRESGHSPVLCGSQESGSRFRGPPGPESEVPAPPAPPAQLTST